MVKTGLIYPKGILYEEVDYKPSFPMSEDCVSHCVPMEERKNVLWSSLRRNMGIGSVGKIHSGLPTRCNR